MSSPDLPHSRVIGFDGSRLTGRLRTGTETYSWELLRRLAPLADEGELRVYLNAAEVPEGLPGGPEYRLIPARRLWTHARLAHEVSRDAPGVLFVPAHVIPVRHPRSVVTIHDAAYRVVPNVFSARERAEIDAATRWNIREAAQVITVSRQTRSDIADLYSAGESDPIAIHHGIDERFRPQSPAAIDDIRRRYELDQPFILSVGTQHPRKNFETLIRAFVLLRQQGLEIDLVIAGAPGPATSRLEAMREASAFAPHIRLLNYLPDADLPHIYASAELFILPSWHEGFGMPALEAMACGTPVVAASTGALPEVCGSAARYVPPGDVEAMADVMANVLGSEPERARMIDVGLAWSRRFTWERSARMTLNVLRAVRDGERVTEERLAWSDAALRFQRMDEERQR